MTLHRHGVGKPEILAALFEQFLEEERAELWEPVAGDGSAAVRLRAVLERRCELAEHHLDLSPSPGLAFPAAALAGIVVVAGYTSTVVLGQRMLPDRETFAAGMTLGFAMGAGGLAVALLGPLADAAGPQAALWISGALAALAVPASLRIGGHRRFAGRPSATAAG